MAHKGRRWLTEVRKAVFIRSYAKQPVIFYKVMPFLFQTECEDYTPSRTVFRAPDVLLAKRCSIARARNVPLLRFGAAAKATPVKVSFENVSALYLYATRERVCAQPITERRRRAVRCSQKFGIARAVPCQESCRGARWWEAVLRPCGPRAAGRERRTEAPPGRPLASESS